MRNATSKRFPQIRPFCAGITVHANLWDVLTKGWRIQKTPRIMMLNSTMHGASNSSKKITSGSILIGHSDKQKTEKTLQPTRLTWINLCVLNSQKNSCDQSKYFQTIEAYFSEQQILFHRIFTLSETDSVPETEDTLLGTHLHLEKRQLQSGKVNILLNSLCG